MNRQHASMRKRVPTGILIALFLLMSSGCISSCSAQTGGSTGGNANFPFAEPPSTPLICPNDQGGGQSTFVSEDGTQLIYQGKPLKLSGYAFYPDQIGGATAWHETTFPSYIDHILDLGALAGQNLIRPTDFWDTPYHDQKQDDVTIWKNLDYLVCAARQRGIFVQMDVSAFGHFLVSQGYNPFDASNWKTFLDAVGKHYSDQPSIAFYSILGEPTPPTSFAAMNTLVEFYRTVTNELRNADGQHLITAGGFNHMEQETPQTPWWQKIYSLPNNDIVAFKTYSLDDLNLIPKIAAFGKSLGKPMVDEEFGLPQSMGDASYTGEVYNNLQTSRAQFYEDVYSFGEQAGVVGFAFWDLGCEIRDASYQVNPNTPSVWQAILRHAPNKPTAPETEKALC
jgi:hypothetical protein